MIGYYTDNEVSQVVMNSLNSCGIETKHISEFVNNRDKTPIFYGILRGTGEAINYCRLSGSNFIYIDNGYYDAEYVNENMCKRILDGCYRVVKNDLIDHYVGSYSAYAAKDNSEFLILKPSPYAAFMNGTTPEDWLNKIIKKLEKLKFTFRLRDKSSEINLEEDIDRSDGVIGMNSVGVLKGVDVGKAVYDTHGIFRNFDELYEGVLDYYDGDMVRDFLLKKQFNLKEIKGVGLK